MRPWARSEQASIGPIVRVPAHPVYTPATLIANRTLGQDAQNLVHLFLETDLEDAVRLVDDERLEVLVHEAVGVLQVVEQAAGRRHQQVHALGQLLRLRAPGGANRTSCVRKPQNSERQPRS